ncbi:MAG: ectoine/hydroxyectoine ABC transporter permease subunit EhuC [Sneathiella sp.]|mgnify:FL=1|jgi:polar amino acid transport system permease protein|uniref:ectoine/hydroxyectoine ABC transporter permease subunit EhuC n=1 Tax=Sneathiella sp. TaxID=1964365 RepID=UPI000C687D20|nr:ectoine/hydroxyectoine ABC transporter permease subunit EhuC [Sneathiella sp.]MAL80665.1 ectoine/hydroxyectoine ABC transporter permease subunit EhuC [Sneathiella sp.]
MNVIEADWLGYVQLMLEGALVTVELTVYGSIIAFFGAFILGLAKLSPWFPLRWLAIVYIEFFRGSSIFVQLFWAYFVLPLIGFPLSALATGIMVLGLNVSAYGAEVVRGAILTVPKEQWEASVALNLTKFQRMRHIILPQAIVVMLPTFSNNVIELMKASAVVSLISLADLTFQSQVIRLQTGNTLLPFAGALLIYFILSLIIVYGIRRIENKMAEGLDVVRS